MVNSYHTLLKALCWCNRLEASYARYITFIVGLIFKSTKKNGCQIEIRSLKSEANSVAIEPNIERRDSSVDSVRVSRATDSPAHDAHLAEFITAIRHQRSAAVTLQEDNAHYMIRQGYHFVNLPRKNLS